MKRTFPFFLLACATATAAAQFFPPAGADYFSETIEQEASEPAPAGLPHSLVLHDGAILHGELAAITKTEIVWKRPDVEPAIRFQRSEVQRLILRAPAAPGRVPIRRANPNGDLDLFTRLQAGATVQMPGEQPASRPVGATVQLTEGDWLHGDLRSTDGRDFTLQLTGGLAVSLPRKVVEWLYFSPRPAPGWAFSGDPLELEGWQFGNGQFGIQDGPKHLEQGILKLEPEDWVGRSMAPIGRFVVEWTTPKGSESNSRLWLHPSGSPAPDRFGSGTVALTFRPGHFTREFYYGSLTAETLALPKDDDAGPTRFQVFYDSGQNRLAAFRNGKMIGDWKLFEASLDISGALVVDRNYETAQPIGAVSFNGRDGTGAELRSFRLRPWDGVLPKAGAAPGEDRFTGGTERALAGKLETVGENNVGFADQARPRAEGTFIELAQVAAPLPQDGVAFAGEAQLSFGEEGDLTVADLEISDGRLKCRTRFAPQFDGPTAPLRTILFPRTKGGSGPVSDMLVFRNGDTFSGTLLGAAKGERIRWRTVGGQEIGFNGVRIAGVRLHGAAPGKATAGTLLELRNGDRLRLEAVAADGDRLRLKHSQLGDLIPTPESLWAMYFNAGTWPFDTAPFPESSAGANPSARRGDRILLDGSLLQLDRTGTQQVVPPAQYAHTFKTLPERYEIRAEAIDSRGMENELSFLLMSANDGPGVRIALRFAGVSVSAFNLPKPKGEDPMRGAFKVQFGDLRRAPLLDPLAVAPPRRAVRLFVDVKLGTVEVFVNGEAIAKFGQNAAERLPGIGAEFKISRVVPLHAAAILGGVWVGPWNGELPRPGAEAAGISLNNTDFAAGAFRGLSAEHLTLDSPAGPIDIPLERVTSLRFGGEPAPVKAAARLRLRDGSILHLDEFRWEQGEVHGRSAALGELKIPAAGVAELILSPTPIRFPQAVAPRKPGGKAPPMRLPGAGPKLEKP